MHRALMIQEVVHRIVDNLNPYHHTIPIQGATAALLNVALTCHSFLGPALDTLWYTIHDLTVLFKLLPNFIAPDGTTLGIIWDNILEADLHTFNSYAYRVRCYIQEKPSTINISAFINVLKGCNRACLLPNLQHLSTKLSKLDSPELLYLMSPRLRIFKHSRWGSVSGSPKILLDSLRKSSPDLVILDLNLVALDALSLSALNAFRRLEELDLHHAHTPQPIAIHVEFLLNISARMTLRRLTLRGEQLEIVPLSPSTIQPPSIYFPALEHIVLTCDVTIATLNTFLCSATFPVLESLRIIPFVRLPNEADHWHRFFDCIGSVTTNRFGSLTLNTPTGPVLSSIPNLSRLSLRLLSLGTRIFGGMCRQDIITIINAWPQLAVLRLISHDETLKIDFSILFDIAMGLPCLTELGLTIDAHHLPDVDDTPILSHELVKLDLNLLNCNTGQVQDIAQSLDRLFPYLEDCTIFPYSEDEDEYEHWSAVEGIIYMLQKARKAESIRNKRGT